MNDDLVSRVAWAIRQTPTRDGGFVDYEDIARAAISAVEVAAPPVTGEVGELVERLKEVTALLMRYRMETPMGHSPHMICHQADAAIERANATLSNTEQPS